ncbi:hypothetical protein D1632_00340 [Chryseobacterium nematophagum]|uniref:Uncharacterized protein n=1 Tax=Chryseobacterium nematophagum TaxID=2305228 RepID=A0A3M7LGP0_9FLAO|nr:hypothetical protein [Chryseobacterium nematophagum]RMZ61294.1 hypothetical protein D1632_00340 [Chryseobacterium nematophagum]
MEKETEKSKQEKNVIVEKIKNTMEKVLNYIKENPRNIFYTMVGLTIFSIISNVLYYNYTIKNAKLSYKQMSDKLFNTDEHKTDKKQNISIMQQAGDYLEMKKDLGKLKEFQSKKNLTKQDTLEIQRITKKYNLR